jgi:hypothetical protein
MFTCLYLFFQLLAFRVLNKIYKCNFESPCSLFKQVVFRYDMHYFNDQV